MAIMLTRVSSLPLPLPPSPSPSPSPSPYPYPSPAPAPAPSPRSLSLGLAEMLALDLPSISTALDCATSPMCPLKIRSYACRLLARVLAVYSLAGIAVAHMSDSCPILPRSPVPTPAHTPQAMPSMLLTPLIMWILLVGWAALWIFTMVFMISADDFTTVNATVGTGYGHVKYIPMEDYDNFFWYFTFGLFWVSQFFIAVEQMILAGKDAPNGRRGRHRAR